MTDINRIANIEQANNKNTTIARATSNTESFSSYLGESKSMDAIFQEASDKYNVPVNFLKAIGKAESNFNASAISRSGAVGVMQLMPKTAAYLGVNDSYNAEQNIMGGAKYIKELLDKYNGDKSLALAAYNAGMGNVKKYGGIPPFNETQNYVKKVLNYMKSDIDTGVITTSATRNTSSSQVSSSYTYNYLIGSSSDTVLDELDEVFNYDKYLQFLELFMKMNEDKESDEKEDNHKNTMDVSKGIQYSIPVMNLLKSTKL